MHPVRVLGGVFAMLCLCVVNAAAVGDSEFPKGTFSLKGPDDTVWALDFDGKGTVIVTAKGKKVVESRYKVTKDEIEFKDVKGDRADQSGKPGTYKWKLEGDKLTFTTVNDESKGRARALTSGAWERVKKTP